MTRTLPQVWRQEARPRELTNGPPSMKVGVGAEKFDSSGRDASMERDGNARIHADQIFGPVRTHSGRRRHERVGHGYRFDGCSKLTRQSLTVKSGTLPSGRDPPTIMREGGTCTCARRPPRWRTLHSRELQAPQTSSGVVCQLPARAPRRAAGVHALEK